MSRRQASAIARHHYPLAIVLGDRRFVVLIIAMPAKTSDRAAPDQFTDGKYGRHRVGSPRHSVIEYDQAAHRHLSFQAALPHFP